MILTHSPTLHAAQTAGFDQALAKATRALAELAATLARGNTRRPPAAVQAAIDAITRPRWVGRVLTTDGTGEYPADLRLTWRIDPIARRALEKEIFGKRILVTDHDDWTIPDVVAAYRSQSDVRLGRVDGGHGAPDRRFARRHEPAGARVPAGAEPLQRLRRQVADVVRDRPEAGGAGQRRGRDHRADGRDPVADPPFLSRVGQPFEQAEQPAVPGQRDRVHVDSSSGCEQRMRVGSGEDGRRVAVQ